MYLSKFFLHNRVNMIYLFTALAISMIIVSSFASSIIYVYKITNSTVKNRGYRLIICLSSIGGKGIDELNTTRNIISQSIRYEKILILYLSLLLPEKGKISINNTMIEKIALFYLYIPGLKHKYIEYIGKQKGLSVRSGHNTLSIDKYYSFSGLLFTPKTSNRYYILFIREIKDTILAKYKVSGFEPYYLHQQIINIVNPNYLYSRHDVSNIIILYTGDIGDIVRLDKYKSMNSIRGYSQTSVFDITPLGKQYRVLEYSSMFIAVIWPRIDEYLYPYSISLSRQKILSSIDNIYNNAADSGFKPGLIDSAIYDIVDSLRGLEFIVRISIIASLLPVFAIVWITGSVISPIIIAPVKKLLALLRLRGFPLKTIFIRYIYMVIIYLVIGAFIGFILGFLIVKPFTYGDKIFYSVFTGLFDPLTIVLVVFMILVLVISAIIKSYHTMKNISPMEFFSKYLYFSPMEKRGGLDKVLAFMIILSIYFLVRIFNLVNPYKLSIYAGGSVLLSIVLALLYILEPVVMFFGPVIFIYTIARLYTSYPRLLSSSISLIAGAIIRGMRGLVYRIMEFRIDRVSLSIIAYSFSLSLILLGLISSASMTPLFNNLKHASTGGVDYVAYTYLVLNHDVDLEEYGNKITGSVSRLINGSYIYAYLYLGETPSPKYSIRRGVLTVNNTRIGYGSSILADNMTISYILFIPRGFGNIVYYGSNMFHDNGEINNNLVIVNSPRRMERVTIYSLEGGARRELANVEPIYARNLPCPLCFYLTARDLTGGFSIDTAEYAPNSVIYIVYPSNPGIIAPLRTYRLFVGSSNNSRSVFVFYLFIRGSIDDAGLRYRGFRIVALKSYSNNIDNTAEYFRMSFNVNTVTGLSLYVYSLIILVESVYTIVYEDKSMYALLHSRGLSRRFIARIILSIALSLAIISLVPGIFLGLIMVYSLPGTVLYTLPVVAEKMVRYYGIVYTVSYPFQTIILVIILVFLPLLFLLVESVLLYKWIISRRIEVLRGRLV